MAEPHFKRLIHPTSHGDVWRLCGLYTLLSVTVSMSVTSAFAVAHHWNIADTLAPAVLLPLFLAPWMTYSIAHTALKLHQAQEELERLSQTDYLTGALNRRGLAEMMSRAYANRATERLCAIVVDIDHFKAINDDHGHAGGDAAIAHIAQTMQGVLKPAGASIGRLGGDELGALLPGATLAQAAALAEQLRSAIEHMRFTHNGRDVRVTTSIGVAELLPGDARPDDMLVRADASLYEAKNGGRNVVRVDFSRHAA